MRRSSFLYNLFDFTHCELSGNSEVGQLGLALRVQQDVSCFDVSVDFSHEVKILQTLQS